MLAEVLVQNFLKAASRGEATLSAEVVSEFKEDCGKAIQKQFNRNPEWRIRMSGLGKPLCQQICGRDGLEEEMSYNAILRFLIGDLVEAALMAILRGAGIPIVDAQSQCELEISGETVRGTSDIILDDPVGGRAVWDIKSASPFSYSQKFGKGYDGLKGDDPFGYLMQGYLYSAASQLPFGGWIVVDKSSGEIQFVSAPDNQEEDSAHYMGEASRVVEALMSNFKYTKPPMKPEDEQYRKDGTTISTGNKLLNKSCTFCGYRAHCWPKAVLHEKVTSKAKQKPLAWYHTLKVTEL